VLLVQLAVHPAGVGHLDRVAPELVTCFIATIENWDVSQTLLAMSSCITTTPASSSIGNGCKQLRSLLMNISAVDFSCTSAGVPAGDLCTITRARAFLENEAISRP
jgi:hypothetical protein